MIPKVVKSRDGRGTGGTGFRGLGRYVCEKAASVRMLNLLGEVWSLAAAEMRLVANTNSRVKKPVYHCILSWHQHERPTDAQMFESAIEALKELGVEEHQALLAIHRDRDHHHIHIVLNRIHPVSGKAMSTSHDFAKLERVCREMEARHGFTQDRGRFDVQVVDKDGASDVRLVAKGEPHWKNVQTRRDRGDRQDTSMDRLRERTTGDLPLKALLRHPAFRPKITATMSGATWAEVHSELGALGLEIRQHGSGARLFIRGTEEFMSPSHLGRAFGFKQLCARLGEYEAPPMGLRRTVDAEPRYRPTSRVEPAALDRKQRFKAKLLADHYRDLVLDDAVVADIRRVELDGRPPRIVFRDRTEVRDEGDRLTSTARVDVAAQTMVEMAAAKGWTTLTFTGSHSFKAEGVRLATLKGLEVTHDEPTLRLIVERTKAQMARDAERAETEQLISASDVTPAQRENSADELEQLNALDLPSVAQRRGYAVDEQASAAAGRDQLVMRKGDRKIVLKKASDCWVFKENRTGDAGGVIQFWQAETGANLGQVRKALRDMIGVAPATRQSTAPLDRDSSRDHTAARQQWMSARPVNVLEPPEIAAKRALDPDVLVRFHNDVRVDRRGALLFAHRGETGDITGFEVRSPSWKGFANGGTKQLAVFGDVATANRIVVVEGGIDALSLAQMEGRSDTAYVSTGGGVSRRALDQLKSLAAGKTVDLAFDADAAGDQLAAQIATALSGVAIAERQRPPSAYKDWNALLQARVQTGHDPNYETHHL